MKNLNIAFVGGGNMAEAMIAGLIRAGHRQDAIMVAEPNADRRTWLRDAYKVRVTDDNRQAMEADIVVLAVKPQQVRQALSGISDLLGMEQILLSIVAGVSTDRLREMVGDAVQLVRVMPNTPALVGAGISALYSEGDENCRRRAEYLMRACGETLWVSQEKDLHAVTAVSGSGPAYFFLLAELLAGAGQSLGLSAETAARLATHTALGAGRMLVESGRTPSELRQQVTSPNGTTQAALDVMYEQGLPEIVRSAVAAAAKRSVELGS
ncbi:MAG: pyrroline-5-carboxylate reductase [Zetaproteobacteria bacterium]|nr:MAG: pyrroline-5-carboxylate reductase [Zetaproteobacteria bacterium]